MTTNNTLRALLFALTLGFAGLIGFSLRDTSAREGAAAPNFQLTTDQGTKVTVDSFGGKVLVLNFWASWCAPCVQEIPSLNAMQRRFAQSGLVVLAVSVDKNARKYQDFLHRLPVAFKTVRDEKADVSAAYGTFVYPETYIIKDGRVVRKVVGAENWASDDMAGYIRGLL